MCNVVESFNVSLERACESQKVTVSEYLEAKYALGLGEKRE